jgi:uncharacterized protein DUF1206
MAKDLARQKLFGRWRVIPSWARILARIGYGAKAVIYLLIGGYALDQAFWNHSTRSGPTQAMHLLRQQPLGAAALGLLAAGMFCYGLHRCLESVVGPVKTDSRLVETLNRLGRFTGGLGYLGLGSLAVEFMLSRNRSGASETPTFAKGLMHHTLGNALLTVIGAILVATGVKQVWDILNGRYQESYDLERPAKEAERAIQVCAIYGIFARGAFFLLCGGLVIYAGFRSDPNSARGMEAVLDLIHKLPLGTWLFAFIAFGFVAYGLFCVVRAVYGKYPSDVGV